MHQVYDYDYCFHALRWLQHYATLKEFNGATPEGYPTGEPCRCPIRPSSFIETEPTLSSVRFHQETYLILANGLDLFDALVNFRRFFRGFTDAYCTVSVGYRTVPYNLPLMSRTVRCLYLTSLDTRVLGLPPFRGQIRAS